VVDYGGVFHDDVKPGHQFGAHDHRSFRPSGWVEEAESKLDRMRPLARTHHLTMLQLACAWNLSQPPVKSVVPTLIQEGGAGARPIESKLDEVAGLPNVFLLKEEVDLITGIGNNCGCMSLKGANRSHTGAAEADRWGLSADLEAVGKKWNVDPDRDLACTPLVR
jgi:hypothetical protein